MTIAACVPCLPKNIVHYLSTMAEADPLLVLVTGASGYIATHLIKNLLKEGVYRVRGTVRNLQATEKVKISWAEPDLF